MRYFFIKCKIFKRCGLCYLFTLGIDLFLGYCSQGVGKGFSSHHSYKGVGKPRQFKNSRLQLAHLFAKVASAVPPSSQAATSLLTVLCQATQRYRKLVKFSCPRTQQANLPAWPAQCTLPIPSMLNVNGSCEYQLFESFGL